MFDYKANPFYLNDNEIKWVEDTYEGMSLEEKLGQLFCPIVFTKDEKELKELVFFPSSSMSGLRLDSGILASTSSITRSINLMSSCI